MSPFPRRNKLICAGFLLIHFTVFFKLAHCIAGIRGRYPRGGRGGPYSYNYDRDYMTRHHDRPAEEAEEAKPSSGAGSKEKEVLTLEKIKAS